MDSSSSWSSDAFPVLEPILPSVASSTRGFCSGNGLLDQLCTSTSEDSAAFSPETLASSSHHDCASIRPSLPIIGSAPFMQDKNFGDCEASEISNGILAASRPKDENHESSGSVVSSESESSLRNGSNKKLKVDQSGTQSKTQISQNQVRKLGEKINALQQLVSPFGKTDTASVLSEAIGYIQFLQDQVHRLSLPYLTTSANRKGCEAKPDLRSRGLCLVPISCTSNVANNNGADYWISGIR